MSAPLAEPVSTSAMDVVGVFQESGTSMVQVFPEANQMKLSVNHTATFFKHPLESSATRTDHIIIDPVEIVLDVMLTGIDFKSIYESIKQLFLSQAKLIVQTRADTYENMYIQGLPRDETPDVTNAVLISIVLAETQFANTTVTFVPANLRDSDTVDRGEVEPKEANESQNNRGSLLFRAFN